MIFIYETPSFKINFNFKNIYLTIVIINIREISTDRFTYLRQNIRFLTEKHGFYYCHIKNATLHLFIYIYIPGNFGKRK